MELVLPGERVDDLQLAGLRIIQMPGEFCFGLDAVLLADFAAARPRDRVADLGTGTGILPLLIYGREPGCTFHAFEIQPQAADRARRSMVLNHLSDRVIVHAADMREAAGIAGFEQTDLVVANPPYFIQNAGQRSEPQRQARFEDLPLVEWAISAFRLLRARGRFCVVLPASRLLALTDALRQARLEPKRLRLVYPRQDRPPALLLMEALKQGRPGLQILPPLIVRDAQGQDTPEIRRIYHLPESASSVPEGTSPK